MPRKPISSPIRNPQPYMRLQSSRKQTLAESRINGGMVTTIDPADLPPNVLQMARNVNVRFDKIMRRPGSRLFMPDPPNVSPVLKLAAFKKKNGNIYTLRMTPNGIHEHTNAEWLPYAGTLNGSTFDRFQTAIVLDEFVFSNNGADYIQRIDPEAKTFSRLGNAPQYRYITGFYNRVVGAARINDNEVEVGWSADGHSDIWSSDDDETAGSSPILESPADLADWITGIFAFTNVMVLLRERSVWLVTKQPIPTNPFNFYTAVPGIGCDSPHSAAIVSGGIAWLDRRTGTVYAYSPGAAPEPIGRPIENRILQNVEDPHHIFSTYAPVQNEYAVCIPQVGTDRVAVWTYSFRYKTWVFHEQLGIVSANDADLSEGALTIDQLGDTPIDELVGTIDSLGPADDTLTVRAYGRDNGDIAIEDEREIVDAGYTLFQKATGGATFDSEYISKVFTLTELDEYISEVRVEYSAMSSDPIKLYVSFNGGATSDSWRLVKEATAEALGEPQLLIHRKFYRCRKFAFKVVTTAAEFAMLSFEVHYYPSGRSNE